jgi:very-short-patch-repair endonuclease
MSEFERLRLLYSSALSAKGRFIRRLHAPLLRQIELTEMGGHSTLDEKLYALRANLPIRPLCRCGKNTRLQASSGYAAYCGSSCAVSDPCTIRRRVERRLQTGSAVRAAQTCAERYGRDGIKALRSAGVEKKYGAGNVFSVPDVRAKIAATLVKRYGVKHPSQVPEIKEKTKRTNITRYGVEHASQNARVRQKTEETNVLRYGTKTSWSNPEIREKINISFARGFVSNKLKQKLEILKTSQKLEMIAGQEWSGVFSEYHWRCGNCQSLFLDNAYYPSCNKCSPRSLPQQNCEKLIEALGVEIKTNDRSVIKPLELDIVIPQHKLAVEVNGWYWHQDGFGTPILEKTQIANRAGWNLLHFWDYEINEKPLIVQGIIRSKLGLNKKIGARQLRLQKINQADAAVFFEANHLQGSGSGSTIALVTDNNEILIALQYGKPRFSDKHDLEIIRLASKIGITVAGGFSRLLSTLSGSVVTYADRRISQGSCYNTTGFTITHSSKPNYSWHKGVKRLSRYACMKHRLNKILGDKFDSALSEKQNMIANGWSKVYDCGNIVLVKGIEK